MGIGMYETPGIIRELGGALEVRAAEAQGTTFTRHAAAVLCASATHLGHDATEGQAMSKEKNC